ncbi:MAG: FG-GAP repeat protein [Rhodospirillales bacterium]|nr:FG-GAP repeat protein [Rhodospirillales bacterium]
MAQTDPGQTMGHDIGQSHDSGAAHSRTHFQAGDAQTLTLPGTGWTVDAEILQEGEDLVLQAPDGSQAVVHGYFTADHPPVIQGTEGGALTPALVHSFVHDAGPVLYAAAGSATDVSPVGQIDEMDGQATIIRTDGSKEPAAIGTPVYEGDVIETGAHGSVNIVFADETSFAVSENARLAIDEYVYDPANESGETHFSVLRGMFVFTSGLVGREDPDDVKIETPMGSIGIRGTIIAGNADSGEITVVEGAIVLRAPGGGEITLANQFDTARFTQTGAVEHVGTLSATDIAGRFSGLSGVAPTFFNGIGGGANSNESAPEPGSRDPASASDVDGKPAGDAAPGDALDGKPAGDATGLPAPDAPQGAQPPAPIGDGANAGPMMPPPPPPSGMVANFLTGPMPGFGPAPNPLAPPPGGFLPPPPPPTGTETRTGDSTSVNTLPPPPTDPNAGTLVVAPPPPSTTTTTTTTSGATPPEPLNLGGATLPGGVFLVGGGTSAGLALAGMRDTDGDGHLEVAFVKGVAGGEMLLKEWNPVTKTFDLMGTSLNLGLAASSTELHDMNLVSLGDINRDGFDDFAVGAGDGNLSGYTDSGDFRIYSGNMASYKSMLGTAPAADAHFGSGLAGAGDINNDGRADILIGGPGYTSDSGRAVLLFGQNGAISGSVNPLSISPSQGIEIDGLLGYRVGESVASAGDFNGDGIGDFIVGAPGGDAAYLVYGKAQGTGWTVDLTSVDTSVWIKLSGPAGSGFGHDVLSVGDMNGDGRSDVLVVDDTGANNPDHAYVFYGASGVTGLDTASLNGSNGFTINGTNANGLSLKSGGAVGDFNGDGRDDFAVVVGDSSGNNDIYVIYGRDNMAAINNGVLRLSDLQDNRIAFHMVWNGLDGESISISAAGDVTGDGRDDMLIGSDLAGGGLGKVMLVSGQGPQDINPGSVLGTDGADDIITGVVNAYINAGSGADLIRVTDPSVRLVDGGGGMDIMRLDSANMTLNFSHTGSAQIAGIEKIMFNGVNQTLKLGIEDVFALMQQSADNTLRIVEGTGANGTLQIDNNKIGGEGNLDTVYGPLGFASAGTVTEGSVTYDKYTFGSYTLLVDVNVVPAAVI